jgi:hypothetical protein
MLTHPELGTTHWGWLGTTLMMLAPIVVPFLVIGVLFIAGGLSFEAIQAMKRRRAAAARKP